MSTSINDILDAASTMKGGFYNHFKTKEDLFFSVLSASRRLWREKRLYGLDQTGDPLMKLEMLLQNYRDRYLKDSKDFPGGCIFLALSVELDDQLTHLAREINEGFVRLKIMIRDLLEQAMKDGKLKREVSAEEITEMIFSGMVGASVMYGMDKSTINLDRTICCLIAYLRGLRC